MCQNISQSVLFTPLTPHCQGHLLLLTTYNSPSPQESVLVDHHWSYDHNRAQPPSLFPPQRCHPTGAWPRHRPKKWAAIRKLPQLLRPAATWQEEKQLSGWIRGNARQLGADGGSSSSNTGICTLLTTHFDIPYGSSYTVLKGSIHKKEKSC